MNNSMKKCCCANCKYCEIIHLGNNIYHNVYYPDKGLTILECRRYPPKSISENMSVFPNVESESVCGEWRMKDEAFASME